MTLTTANYLENYKHLQTIYKNKLPKDLVLDKNACLAAVSQSGYALKYVPTELRDREICLAAVKQNSYALGYVPRELRDREICLATVKQNGDALYYVPTELQAEIKRVLKL